MSQDNMEEKNIKNIAKKVYRKFRLYRVEYIAIYEYDEKYVAVLIPHKSLITPYNAYDIDKKTLKIDKHKWVYDIIGNNDILESANIRYEVKIGFMGCIARYQ